MVSKYEPVDWDAIETVPFDINRVEEYAALVRTGEYDAEGRKELVRQANARKEAAKKEAEKNPPKSKPEGITLFELCATSMANAARLAKKRSGMSKEGDHKEDSDESKK